MTFRKQFDWKLFWMLLIAGLAGVVASLPLAFELVDQFMPAEEQREIEAQLPLPIPLLVVAALIQNAAVFGVVIASGMALGPRIGTGAPLLEAWLHGPSRSDWLRMLLSSLLAGALVGVVLAMVDAVIFLPHAPAALRHFAQEVALWKRLLAGLLYGGITEELLMRWFLLSLIVWLLGKVWRGDEQRPAGAAWWLGSVIVAVLFGLGHLPATQAIAPLSTVVVTRALVLNGAASLAFSYLFWRRGLEAAMAGHAGAHLGLQILGPMLGRLVDA
jgi:hypothetical protein